MSRAGHTKRCAVIKMNDQKIFKTAHHLVELIVKCDFEELQRISNGVRLSANEMRTAVEDYPATIIMNENMDLQSLDIIEITHSNPKAYSVDIDLWSKEEGRSDLTLQTTLTESDTDLMYIEIDDIHVL